MSRKSHVWNFQELSEFTINLILMLVSVKPVNCDQEQVRSSGVGSKIENVTSKILLFVVLTPLLLWSFDVKYRELNPSEERSTRMVS